MSDAEKLVDAGLKYPGEPLILRPPVGPEIITGWRESTSVFLRKNQRLLKVIALLSIIFLILSVILYFFVWRFIILQHERFESTCSVLFGDPNMPMQEHFSYEPRAITLSHENFQDFPPVRIFHLLADAMSILRTPDQCYAYSLRPEIQSAIPTDEAMIERIKESNQHRIKLRMRISPQLWMLSHESDVEDGIKINHPEAAANCSGRPILRLRQIFMPFSPDQSVEPPISVLPAGQEDPVGCPTGCVVGESRDTVGEVPRRVCRCPPAGSPEEFLRDVPSTGDLDDDDDDDDFDDEEVAPLPVPATGGASLMRNRRSAPAPDKSLGSAVVRIPQGCKLKTKVLEGGLPNQKGETVPEMMILSC